MKTSKIFRLAAKKIENRQSHYGCTAIRDALNQASGSKIYFDIDSVDFKTTRAYKLFEEHFKPTTYEYVNTDLDLRYEPDVRNGELPARWFGPSFVPQIRDERIFALLLAAEIAKDQEF